MERYNSNAPDVDATIILLREVGDQAAALKLEALTREEVTGALLAFSRKLEEPLARISLKPPEITPDDVFPAFTAPSTSVAQVAA